MAAPWTGHRRRPHLEVDRGAGKAVVAGVPAAIAKQTTAASRNRGGVLHDECAGWSCDHTDRGRGGRVEGGGRAHSVRLMPSASSSAPTSSRPPWTPRMSLFTPTSGTGHAKGGASHGGRPKYLRAHRQHPQRPVSSTRHDLARVRRDRRPRQLFLLLLLRFSSRIIPEYSFSSTPFSLAS